MIAHTELTSLLDYDQLSGSFTWKVSASRTKAGSVAGCTNARGYVYIGVGGKLYRANRLAWFYVHGKWPAGQIDHINGDRGDNRIENLRDVSGSINQKNRKRANHGSTSRFLGVSFHPATGKWRSQISVNHETKYLGLYDSEEGAHAAYLTAKAALS